MPVLRSTSNAVRSCERRRDDVRLRAEVQRWMRDPLTEARAANPLRLLYLRPRRRVRPANDNGL